MATAIEKKTDATVSPLAAIEKFLSQKDFELRLTYGFLPEQIVIPAVLILDDDAKAARQKFYSQPDDVQSAGLHAYNVEMLKAIVAGRPRGLPGFDDLLGGPGKTIDQIREAIGNYFAIETDLSKMLASDIVNLYVQNATPREFFR